MSAWFQNIYANKAVEIIENHNTSVPFFMYAPLQSTHDPLQAPKVIEILSFFGKLKHFLHLGI